MVSEQNLWCYDYLEFRDVSFQGTVLCLFYEKFSWKGFFLAWGFTEMTGKEFLIDVWTSGIFIYLSQQNNFMEKFLICIQGHDFQVIEGEDRSWPNQQGWTKVYHYPGRDCFFEKVLVLNDTKPDISSKICENAYKWKFSRIKAKYSLYLMFWLLSYS